MSAPSTPEHVDAPAGASSSRAGLARRLGFAALALVLILGPLWLRVWIDGAAELRSADAAAAAGDRDGELRHLGRAARARLPLATHDERARARLQILGEQADAAGETREALAAWRELRRALLGSRTIGVADDEQLEVANAAIVELMVIEASELGAPIERERWTAQLAEPPGGEGRPRWRSLLASACFAAWLVACIGLFVAGIDAKGRLSPRPALRWGASAIVLLIAWISLM